MPHGNQWAVKGEKNERATKIVDTQTEASKIARDIAINQKSELIIHRPNGQIRDKDSHGFADVIGEVDKNSVSLGGLQSVGIFSSWLGLLCVRVLCALPCAKIEEIRQTQGVKYPW